MWRTWRFQPDNDLREKLRAEWNKRIKKVRRTELILGIIMIIIGLLCIFFPMDSVSVMGIVASAAIMIFGIYEIVEFFSLPVYFRMGGLLVSGILNLLTGILLLALPSEDMLTVFSFLFAIDILIIGIEEISMSSTVGWIGLGDSGWLLASGIVNILVSLLFFFAPIASILAMGILVGIYLIIGGVMMLIEFSKTKDAEVKNDDDVIDIQ
ncbi:MAG: DUF308 domain-containing protein [Eubacteriales bacterium]|jgi:uncharacterized membrane protein HdeD (DUF308 family)